MKISLKALILSFLISSNSQSKNGTILLDTTYYQTVCKYCAADIQAFVTTQISPLVLASGSRSILVVKGWNGEADQNEAKALDDLTTRVLSFSKVSDATSFSRKLVLQAEKMKEINYKLFYQLAIDSEGRTSYFSERDKPF